MRRSGLYLCVALVSACVPTPRRVVPPGVPAPVATAPAASSPAEWTTIDVMPDWWAFWAAAADQPRVRQRELFDQLVVEQHPALFGEAVLSIDRSAPFELEPRVDALLEVVPPLVPTMRRLSEQLEDELPRHRATFTSAFEDFAWRGKVYFTVSLLVFDGAVRDVDGEEALVFGLDKIAQLHGESASLAPLFHHELFHVYHFGTHAPFGPGPSRIYQALWGEGLAVWVSRELNPGASLSDILMSAEMVAAADAIMPRLAAELRAELDSEDADVYRDFFRGSGQRDDLPKRAGYYVGLRVAEILARGRTARQLAELADPQLRREIEVALRELEGAEG